MKHCRQHKIRLLIALLLVTDLQAFSQKKNEFYIQGGYSQASQSKSIFNLFQTSFWRQNIHNGYFSTEYYRNIKEKYSIGINAQLVEKGFKNSYTIINQQLTLYQRYFTKFDY